MQGPEWALFPRFSDLASYLNRISQPQHRLCHSISKRRWTLTALHHPFRNQTCPEMCPPGRGSSSPRVPRASPPLWSGVNAAQSVQRLLGAVRSLQRRPSEGKSCRSSPHRHAVLDTSGHQQKAARLSATAQAGSKSLNSGEQVISPLWPLWLWQLIHCQDDKTKYTLYSFFYAAPAFCDC